MEIYSTVVDDSKYPCYQHNERTLKTMNSTEHNQTAIPAASVVAGCRRAVTVTGASIVHKKQCLQGPRKRAHGTQEEETGSESVQLVWPLEIPTHYFSDNENLLSYPEEETENLDAVEHHESNTPKKSK